MCGVVGLTDKNNFALFKGKEEMKIRCPLCKGSDVTLIEKVKTKNLIDSYNRVYKIDTSSEFAGIGEIGLYRCLDSDLKFFYPMVTGSKETYERFQQFDWYYADEKYEYSYAANFIKGTDEVLEIGAGKGAFANKILCKKYVGLEFTETSKIKAKKNGIYVANESIQDHAKKNMEKYDVVCSFQVIEHLGDIYSCVESSLNCLKPGGLLIYSVPNTESFLSIVEDNILNVPPHHVSWWNERSLKKIAGIFGLKIVEIEHEKLADVHLKYYAHAVTLKGLKSILGLNPSIISFDRTFSKSILYRVASLLSRVYEKGLKDSSVRPNGHSVVAVYRK